MGFNWHNPLMFWGKDSQTFSKRVTRYRIWTRTWTWTWTWEDWIRQLVWMDGKFLPLFSFRGAVITLAISDTSKVIYNFLNPKPKLSMHTLY